MTRRANSPGTSRCPSWSWTSRKAKAERRARSGASPKTNFVLGSRSRAAIAGQQESLGAVLDALNGRRYQVGCFYRDLEDPQKVHLLARPFHAGGESPGFYRMTVDVQSVRLPGCSVLTYLTAIRMRETTPEDFMLLQRFIPAQTRCHAADTAPGG